MLQSGDRLPKQNSKPSAQADARFPGVPAVALPSGGGAVRGLGEAFKTNAAAGTAGLTVPLPVSPGRGGFQPALSLSYDSGHGNGPFGVGWQLAVPAITRKTDRGVPRYEEEPHDDPPDTFLLAGVDLVPAVEASDTSVFQERSAGEYVVRRYRPRIEQDFARIERWTRTSDGDIHWRTLSGDNVLSIFGSDADSRVTDPHEPAHVFSWLIAEQRDDKGNAIVYGYKREDAVGLDLTRVSERNRGPAVDPRRGVQRYLKRVRYGNRVPLTDENGLRPAFVPAASIANADWMFEVVFDYGEHDPQAPKTADNGPWFCRHDPFASYRSGFEVRTCRLCQRVLMFHHFAAEPGIGSDCLVRSTDFVYRSLRGNPDDATRGEPDGSLIASATQSGYVRQGNGYLRRSLPKLEFEYSVAKVQDAVRELDADSRRGLPEGVDGRRYAWVDLDGEGAAGILSEHADAWFYQRNRGGGRFEPARVVARKPATAALADGRQHWADLDGNGRLELVQLDGVAPGFHQRTEDETFESFRPFRERPNLPWRSPDVRFVDLDGDGLADVLITEQEVIRWHPSHGQDGFGPERRVSRSPDEERGPCVLLSDPEQTVMLADVTGDGLTDLVRVRASDICYWPNLGYGRFGAKVTMDDAPVLDGVADFDARRVRLADIDGSGNSDLIYLGRDGVRLYFNQSGNAWGKAHTLDRFPRLDDVSKVDVVDLLGNGTACLVWSSPLPSDTPSPLRYVDLVGGQKPRLLTTWRNNLGTETVVRYAASTRFYNADREAGRPWVTRLSFPVHVVERVETYDHVNRNRFVSRYAYHHGYFDGVEREFRGFGMVEQFDTTELAVLQADDTLPHAANIDAASYVPPAYTKTWFHNGAFFGQDRVSRQYAREYYREGDPATGDAGLADADFASMLLPDSVLPDGLTLVERREASRALKGTILRQEIYAQDDTASADRPYAVSERNYTVRRLQPAADQRPAVFLTHARETIDFHYDRVSYAVGGKSVADPRVTHALVLAVDDFGHALTSVAIGYGRRHADPDAVLTAADHATQQRTLATLARERFTNAMDTPADYRVPQPAETRLYELIHLTPPAAAATVTPLFDFDDLAVVIAALEDESHDLPYDDTDAAGATAGTVYRRVVDCTRTTYRKNDLSGPCALGKLESLALPAAQYRLTFTPGLLARVYVRPTVMGSESLLPDPATVLGGKGADGGGYVDLDHDGNWWTPSPRVFYAKGINVVTPAMTAATELAQARQHFFQPRLFVNPFDQITNVDYDVYDLLPVRLQDALLNTTSAVNDYRVMRPREVTDANGNRTAAASDALGLSVATAMMGKASENLGDTLAGLDADPSPQTLADFMADPLGPAAVALLAGATRRVVYDVNRYTGAAGVVTPAYAATIARDTHVSDLAQGDEPGLTVSFAYSDGFGREIQHKTLAEPGPLNEGAPDVSPRWTAGGWTIFDNKANPVRTYEPFFDDTHAFRYGHTIGESDTLFYDPLGRMVARLRPDHAWEKIVFDPWGQTSWDANDTVLIADPKADVDVGKYLSRLPDADVLPTWQAARSGGTLGVDEKQAATQTAAHAGTPLRSYFDTLGRTFLTVADNGVDDNGVTQKFATRTVSDIEGNTRSVQDALGRTVVRYDCDLAGRRLHALNLDSGERWILEDAAGTPIRTWDSRGHTTRTTYDVLRRPTSIYLTDGTLPEALVQSTIYGEGEPAPQDRNLRGRVAHVTDQAGVSITDRYDFKGNLLSGQRQIAQAYKGVIDWSAPVPLEAEVYASATRYDALNRPVALTNPDHSVLHVTYNEAGLLERVDANLQGDAALTPFVTDIDYDAKGSRTRIALGNGTTTTYGYDPKTYRLRRLLTTRDAAPADVLQDLNYTFDPVGNVTRVRDDAQQTLFFQNQRVGPTADYSYDAVYRLTDAAGREHLGQVGGAPVPHTYNDVPRVRRPQPGDGAAMGLYTENYIYDAVGNMLSMRHRGSDPAAPGWTRAFIYDEPSLIEPSHANNRLTRSTIDALTETYSHAGDGYDAHGNMLRLPHLSAMQWDFKDQLRMTQRQAVNAADADGSDHAGERTWYTYDLSGQRVRKVTETAGGQIKEERRYLGIFEVYRRSGLDSLSRETLHVMDGTRRIATVETRTQGNEPGVPAQQTRYQYDNHLGSAVLELDDTADIVSYEEYTPYGSTAYQAVRSQVEVPKRYRFTGKERDDETGLYYHGARYYAAWLARWTNCDPAGTVDGLNSYFYVRNNPVMQVDPSGHAGTPPKGEAQLWLVESRAFDFDVRATAKGRGFSKAHRKYVKDAIDLWGGPKRYDLTHRDRSFIDIKEGEVTKAGIEERSANRARGAAEKKAGGVRSGNKGVDPTAAPGKRPRQPQPKPPELKPIDARSPKIEAAPASHADAAVVKAEKTAATDVAKETTAVAKESVTAVKEGAVATKEAVNVAAKEGGNVVAKQLVNTGGKEALATAEKTGLKEVLKIGGTKAAKFVPFVGIGVGVGLVGNDLRKGDYVSAAWDTAEAIPVVGDVVGAGHLGITVGVAMAENLGSTEIAANHGMAAEGLARKAGLGDTGSMVVGGVTAGLSAITIAPSMAAYDKVKGWLQ